MRGMDAVTGGVCGSSCSSSFIFFLLHHRNRFSPLLTLVHKVNLCCVQSFRITVLRHITVISSRCPDETRSSSSSCCCCCCCCLFFLPPLYLTFFLFLSISFRFLRHRRHPLAVACSFLPFTASNWSSSFSSSVPFVIVVINQITSTKTMKPIA